MVEDDLILGSPDLYCSCKLHLLFHCSCLLLCQPTLQRYGQCHSILRTVWADQVDPRQLGVLPRTNSQQAIYRAPSYC